MDGVFPLLPILTFIYIYGLGHGLTFIFTFMEHRKFFFSVDLAIETKVRRLVAPTITE